ncbi:uncharacterized protein CTRU02_204238 [Colletotrichum truncatum]|uniref:Uncharacterized protein n=1 Tax=Colletotrichum truncatum TaxID=5467 RepID=A0ACC3ZBU1_COLTU|nr:uncharacterized protein CTRU02_10090 [Colletotrichum truncatum]KAF6787795.1 hypothetical protein CTRU02_10090 [Colletotrichum truncatum]
MEYGIMSNTNWPGQTTDYSSLESGARQQSSMLEVKPKYAENRPSTIDVAIPISTENKSPRNWRLWWRRYWIFVLAMSILVIGGIIAGAVGGITAAEKTNKNRSV